MKFTGITAILGAAFVLSACGGGNGNSNQDRQIDPPGPPTVSVNPGIKQLIFSWNTATGATHYRLLENPDGHSGFTQAGDDIPAGTLTVTKHIAVHLQDWVNALYVVQACNSAGCTGSTEVSAADLRADTIGYLEASDDAQPFYRGVAVSADGNRIAVGAYNAAYLFSFNGSEWSSELMIVLTGEPPQGVVVALSADGDTLAVGDQWDSSSTTGINGDPDDNSAEWSGAVHIFRFESSAWVKQAYIKASNTDAKDFFGGAISLSANGNALAVGASGEGSSAIGINGDQNNGPWCCSGAAYLFRFDGNAWSQQAYIKPSNTPLSEAFGTSVALNSSGDTLAIGAPNEGNCSSGINGYQYAQCPESRIGYDFGAVYLFRLDGLEWWQQAYIKGRSIGKDHFGQSLDLSANGNTLVVGEPSSVALDTSGAYVFRFDGTNWFREIRFEYYLFSDPVYGDPPRVGASIATNDDGTLIALGGCGGPYLLRHDGFDWTFGELGRVVSPPGPGFCFGARVTLSGDSATLVILNDGVYVY